MVGNGRVGVEPPNIFNKIGRIIRRLFARATQVVDKDIPFDFGASQTLRPDTLSGTSSVEYLVGLPKQVLLKAILLPKEVQQMRPAFRGVAHTKESRSGELTTHAGG